MLPRIKPFLRGRKVLFISGYSTESQFPEMGDMFDASFLRKPFAIAELAARVRKTLDGNADSPIGTVESRD
jgi:DNA-binding response OmpR family regulator